MPDTQTPETGAPQAPTAPAPRKPVPQKNWGGLWWVVVAVIVCATAYFLWPVPQIVRWYTGQQSEEVAARQELAAALRGLAGEKNVQVNLPQGLSQDTQAVVQTINQGFEKMGQLIVESAKGGGTAHPTPTTVENGPKQIGFDRPVEIAGVMLNVGAEMSVAQQAFIKALHGSKLVELREGLCQQKVDSEMGETEDVGQKAHLTRQKADSMDRLNCALEARDQARIGLSPQWVALVQGDPSIYYRVMNLEDPTRIILRELKEKQVSHQTDRVQKTQLTVMGQQTAKLIQDGLGADNLVIGQHKLRIRYLKKVTEPLTDGGHVVIYHRHNGGEPAWVKYDNTGRPKEAGGLRPDDYINDEEE